MVKIVSKLEKLLILHSMCLLPSLDSYRKSAVAIACCFSSPAKSFTKKRKKKSKKAATVPPPLFPDPSYLSFNHHRAILGALSLTPAIVCGGGGGGGRRVRGRVLIIGLGGGALPSFIQRYLPQVRLLSMVKWRITTTCLSPMKIIHGCRLGISCCGGYSICM